MYHICSYNAKQAVLLTMSDKKVATPMPLDDEKHFLLQATKDHYEYVALPADGWTRILELHPGSGPLSCTLRCERIEDAALGFEALSYVWGSNALRNTIDIECNNQILSIGSNLACALTHIRHESEPRLLWVDAVCINQRDKGERSQQVQRMGDIYASAKRVLVWIGEDHRGDADECFALIQDTITFLTSMVSQYKDPVQMPSISYGNGFICANPRKWDMVRRLMDSEWFTRVWVLQEVGLARSAVILQGKSSMNWSHLAELMLYVALRPDVAAHTGNVKSGTFWDVFEDIWGSFENTVSWRNELPLMRSLKSTSDGPRLTDILNDGRNYQATDPRDHVYAFLSHPRATCGAGKDEPIVVVDYNKSVDEVYLETASRILETDLYCWTVLSCVDHTPNSPSLSGQRQSWVPRWDEWWRVHWLGYTGMWYRAGGSQPAAFRAEVSTVDSSLEVLGIFLDTIDWTSQAFTEAELVLARQKKGAPLQLLWRELERRGLSTVYGHSSRDREYVYSLVIAAGRAADDGPAEDNPSLHWSVYQAYKDMIRSSDNLEDTTLTEISGECFENSVQLDALTYINNQRRALHNRRLFRTAKGYYGVGHSALEVGDLCYLFRGANVPFVLRQVWHNGQTHHMSNQYRLVGESYIQGIMKGEVLTMLNEEPSGNGGDLIERKVVII
jgi:hypothetical protein